MATRHGTCIDCGAQVVLTNAKPVVRGGAVKLQCIGCAGGSEIRDDGHDGDGDEHDDDHYDAIVVSDASDDSDGSSPASDAPAQSDGVYGARHGSVSGAIEAKKSTPRADSAPAVIINHDANLES